jgi:hypothetical protein
VFRLCQVLVLVIRVITPFSYLYLLLLCIYGFKMPYLGTSIYATLLTTWMCVEALFFPYYYYIFNQLNYKSAHLNHYGSTSEKRRKLVADCMDAIEKSTPPKIASGYNCSDEQRCVQKVLVFPTPYLMNLSN